MVRPGEETVTLLSELVAIDSVNPGLVAGAAGERQIVEHLITRLQGSGFDTHVVPAGGAADRPSLVAISPAPAGAPTVVLNGHLDTVGVAGMGDPFTPRVEGDRLYARGAADMKGGIAGIVTAAAHLAASRVPVRIVLALVADEEDASLGSEAVIAALPDLGVRPDVCVIAEPTDLALGRSLRGFAVVRVHFAGRAAHSSQAELGLNAVTHLGRFLHAVDVRAEEVRSAGGDLMATLVSGGESQFVIPDHAECVVELRIAPGDQRDPLPEVLALLDPAWDATAEVLAHRPAWRLDDTGAAATLSAAIGEALGTGPTFDAPYWMEAPLWQQICPTAICGPSGGGLHAIDEWVDLAPVRSFVGGLIRALESWVART